MTPKPSPNNGNEELKPGDEQATLQTSEIAEPTQAEIDSWKKKHGKVYRVERNGHSYYFSYPTRTQYSYFSDLVASKQTAKATETLVRECLIWPSEKEYYDHFNKDVALASMLGSALIEAVTGKELPEAKKV
jgi:hypothetical protein